MLPYTCCHPPRPSYSAHTENEPLRRHISSSWVLKRIWYFDDTWTIQATKGWLSREPMAVFHAREDRHNPLLPCWLLKRCLSATNIQSFLWPLATSLLRPSLSFGFSYRFYPTLTPAHEIPSYLLKPYFVHWNNRKRSWLCLRDQLLPVIFKQCSKGLGIPW